MSTDIGYTFKVKEIPNELNGMVGIVEASVKINNQQRTDFGVSSESSINSKDVSAILADAKQNAIQNIQNNPFRCDMLQDVSHMNLLDSNDLKKASPIPRKYNKHKSRGGGNKPASQKQQDLIKNLCARKSLDPNDECAKMNANLKSLTGQQASDIIQSLIAPK